MADMNITSANRISPMEDAPVLLEATIMAEPTRTGPNGPAAATMAWPMDPKAIGPVYLAIPEAS